MGTYTNMDWTGKIKHTPEEIRDFLKRQIEKAQKEFDAVHQENEIKHPEKIHGDEADRIKREFDAVCAFERLSIKRGELIALKKTWRYLQGFKE